MCWDSFFGNRIIVNCELIGRLEKEKLEFMNSSQGLTLVVLGTMKLAYFHHAGLVTWCDVVFSIGMQSHVFALSCTLCLSWQATVWKQSIKEESLRAFVMMVFSPVGSLLVSLLCIFSHLQLDVLSLFHFVFMIHSLCLHNCANTVNAECCTYPISTSPL